MISNERWQFAQHAEEVYQRQKANANTHNMNGIISIAEQKSEYVVKLLSMLEFATREDHSAIEIGSGSHGMIWKLPCKDRTAIDPLADFYFEKFQQLQDNGTKIIAAKGEDIPLPDECADIVLSENVLDHTHQPVQVLHEVARLLRPGGRFYCSVDVHGPVWFLLNGVYNLLFNIGLKLNVRAFPAHPHHFRKKDVQGLFEKVALRVLWHRSGNPVRTSGSVWGKIKFWFGKNGLIELVATK